MPSRSTLRCAALCSIIFGPAPVSGAGVVSGVGSNWDRIGPWNIFDGTDPTKSPSMGEAGTLASAASPAGNPDLIYAGGQNNGVSSGVLKTVDGGVHWTRNSKGLWDTRILGVWVHPDDPKGGHVLAGTHSGVYESKDFAESWQLCNETATWGAVMSFRQAVIAGKQYIVANGGSGWILTRPLAGSEPWQKIKAPGGMAPNMYLSVVSTAGKTELLTCIGGWGGGKLYYGMLDSPTEITWDGPLNISDVQISSWQSFPGKSAIWGKCKSPTSCNPGVHVLGKMDTLAACQAAVNASHPFKVASWTYQHTNVGGGYGGYCYAMEASVGWEPQPQANVDSGRAPGTVPGGSIDCANAAVDPNDRNHFVYSKGGQYRMWHSEDGGKTVNEFTDHNTGVYFVMIDKQGWLYTATQAGAFVSEDKGATWNPFHVLISMRSGKEMDRVPHDYQNIVPDFRGDGIAFPSDQGLHIVDRTSKNYTLHSAVGDLHNAMSLSALISPSADGKSRNIVSNIWDWDVVASWDDGATWAGWKPGEKSPGSCGEGGGGQGMGTSPHQVMFHHSHWYRLWHQYASNDGGHNFVRGTAPGTPGGGFDYIRKAGSRTEPSGTCFAMLDAPADYDGSSDGAMGSAMEQGEEALQYTPTNDEDEDEDADEEEEEEREMRLKETGGTVKWMMTSTDFGNNYTWVKMPAALQSGGFVVDPTSATSLFTMTPSCLAHSTDLGKNWTPCSKASGLTGRFHQLIVKDSNTMFMLRMGAVPLKTTNGGSSWAELSSPQLKTLFSHGGTFDGSLSWTGKTLVLHGCDLSAIGRQEYGTIVWKSVDDGESFTDETGDLVTISPGPGVWYEKDFYFVTRGEGVTVKRNFEA